MSEGTYGEGYRAGYAQALHTLWMQVAGEVEYGDPDPIDIRRSLEKQYRRAREVEMAGLSD